MHVIQFDRALNVTCLLLLCCSIWLLLDNGFGSLARSFIDIFSSVLDFEPINVRAY